MKVKKRCQRLYCSSDGDFYYGDAEGEKALIFYHRGAKGTEVKFGVSVVDLSHSAFIRARLRARFFAFVVIDRLILCKFEVIGLEF